MALAASPASAQESRTFYFTGYTCDPARGQPYCGGTADGTQVVPGVAACSDGRGHGLPFGTRLLVHYWDADLVVTCHDTFAPGQNIIDVWWPSVADCFAHTGSFQAEILP